MASSIKRVAFIFLFVFNGTIFLAQCPNPITSVTLTVNDQPCGSPSVNGSMTVAVTGGVAPYTYSWVRNGVTYAALPSNAPTNLIASNYIVSVTDACGVAAVQSAQVTLNNAIAIDLQNAALGANALCFGGNGAISASIFGGTSQRSLVVTNIATSQVYTQTLPSGGQVAGVWPYSITVPQGTYTVSAVDAGSTCPIDTWPTNITVSGPSSMLTATTAKTDVCFGGTNGTITVTAAGGTGTKTYSMDGGTTYQSSNVFTGLAAGTYSIVVKDANNCTITPASVTINQSASALVVAVTSLTNLACNGASTGAINITVNGGYNTAYTYAWTGPSSYTATTEDIFNRPAGTYSVTVTDAGGCTQTVSATIAQSSVLATSTSITNILCNGGSTGAINLTVTGGTAPYVYAWTGPSSFTATTEDLTNRSAGVYSVSVTDANGCTATTTVTLSQPPALSVSAVKTNIYCFGGTNGTITTSATGGTPPYTYSINSTTYQSSPNFTGLAAGNYIVTVKDANNCNSNSANLNITQPAVLSISNDGITPASCVNTANGSIYTSVTGGTSPYTYAWSGPNSFISTAQDQSSNLAPGTYNVTATDANSCSISLTGLVITSPPAINISTTATNVTCFQGTNGAINATVTGGAMPYSFDWKKNGVNFATSEDLNGIGAGSYTLVVTDANSCLSSLVSPVIISEGPQVIATITPNGPTTFCSGGTVVLTSSATTGNTWSNGATTQSITVNQSGTFSLTVSNGSCSATSTPTLITVNPVPVIPSASMGSICSGNTFTYAPLNNPPGTIVPNGTTYSWSPLSNPLVINEQSGAGSVITGLLFNNSTNTAQNQVYTVIPQTGNCSGAPFPLTITVQPEIAIVNASMNICSNTAFTFNPSSNGVNIIPSGTMYTWSVVNNTNISGLLNNSTPSSVINGTLINLSSTLQTVVYTVIPQTLNCIGAPFTLVITILPSINATINSQQTNYCSGQDPQVITSSINSVPGTLVYQWMTSSSLSGPWSSITGANVSIYDPGISITNSAYYQLNVTLNYSGGLNCYGASNSLYLLVEPVPSVPSITSNGPTTFCSGGTVVLTSSAATGNVWSNGLTTQSITVNQSGSYTVTASIGSCSASSTPTVVTVNPLPIVTCSPNQTICSGSPVTLTGFGASTYIWNNGVVNNTPFNPINTQTYNVIGTDINGCTGNASVTITVNPTPNVVITSSNTLPLCPGGNTQFSTPIVTGATYQWFLGTNPIVNATTNSYTATIQGAYSVKVTNQLGCQGSSNSLNLSFIQVNLTAQGPLTFCQGGSTQLLTTAGSGFTYKLIKNGLISNNSVSNPLFNIINPGTYRVQVTTPSGCVLTTNQLVVQVLANPTATISSSGPLSFCSGPNLTLQANTNGTNVTYQWRKNGVNIPGANASTYAVNQTGAYSVVISNQICPSTSATTSNVLNITVNPTPNPNITASGLSISPGVNVTLSTTAVAGSTYLWHKFTGSTAYPISGATQNTYTTNISGAYRVKVTNSFGCSAFSSTKVISAVQYPIIGATCQDDGILISKSYVAPNTAQWFELTEDSLVTVRQLGTSSGIKLYDKFEGTFQLIDDSNTERIIYDELIVNCGPELLIFPNPTSSEFQIDNLESIDGISSIKLYDSFGKMIKIYQAEERIFGIEGLSKGIYFLRVETNEFKKTLRLSVQ